MRFIFSFSAVMAVILSTFSTAHAQLLDSVQGDWNVFSMTQQGKKVCYIASAPKQKTGNYKHRSDPYVLVTHINTNVDEASTTSGYPYKQGSEVALTVEGKNYKLFTKGELAWAYDTSQDHQIVADMKAGSSLKVKGNSTKGTYSTDTYSLKGFTAAYNRMKALCK